MNTIGLRELRQQASELVRRVEAGEELTITVSGRPSARIVPIPARTWGTWADVSDLFTGPADPAWRDEVGLLDNAPVDPWER